MSDLVKTEEVKPAPKGWYAVWAEPRARTVEQPIRPVPRTGCWLTHFKAANYDEAIAEADRMNRCNPEWHYYAKPVY